MFQDDLQKYLDGILHIPSLRNHKETVMGIIFGLEKFRN